MGKQVTRGKSKPKKPTRAKSKKPAKAKPKKSKPRKPAKVKSKPAKSRKGDQVSSNSSQLALVEPNEGEATQLTECEAVKLAECEAVIERGIRNFGEAGNALSVIRADRLYRASHKNFDAYCIERWGMKRAHASRMIAAAATVANLSPMGDKQLLPKSERQIRSLTPHPPEVQRKAWAEARKKAGGQPTGKQVKAAVDGMMGRKNKRPYTLQQLDRAVKLSGDLSALLIELCDMLEREPDLVGEARQMDLASLESQIGLFNQLRGSDIASD